LARPLTSIEGRALGTEAHGVLCFRLHDYALGNDRLTESLRLFTQLEDAENIAFVLNHLGNIASDQGRYDDAEHYLLESLALSRQHDFAWNVAASLSNLAGVLAKQGKLDEAVARYAESVGRYRQIGDVSTAASVTSNMASVFYDLGDYAKAQQLYEHSYTTMAGHRDEWRLAYAAFGLANVAQKQGYIDLAKQRYRESIHLFFSTQNSRDTIMALCKLADLEWADGRWPAEKLVEFLSMATAFIQTAHMALEPNEQLDYDKTLAAARAALATDAFDGAWSRGQTLALEAAVAFATAQE